MKYLPGFFTEQAARDYSREAREQSQNPTTTFEFMFSWTKHSARSEWALIIPPGCESFLREGDESRLIDKLDPTWWSQPEAVDPIDKYRVYWAEFAREIIAEFNARNQNLTGAAAMQAIVMLKPVIDALNGFALGAARDILSQIPADPQIFPQTEKDYFLTKINNYLSNWT